MQHLRVLLLVLFVSCYCAPGDSFVVSQFPSTLTLTEGEQVRITCSWNVSITNVKVKWYKEGREVSFNRTDKLVHAESGESNATFLTNDADESDAGFYTCEVTQDIPRLLQKKGTGTNVTYQREPEPVSTTGAVPTPSPSTEKPSTTTKPASTAPPRVLFSGPSEEVYNNEPIIFAIRCVPFVTLLLAVCILSRKETNKVSRAGPRTAQTQDVIMEEEEEEEDEPKEQTAGQKRKEDERNKQPGDERSLENEIMAEDKDVKEMTEQTGHGRELEVVNELTG